MSDEVAFTAVDFLIQTSRHIKDLTVLLFGGEPMMRFDLIQRIIPYANKKAKEAGKTISWDMTTNGTLIDEDRAKWMRHSTKSNTCSASMVTRKTMTATASFPTAPVHTI